MIEVGKINIDFDVVDNMNPKYFSVIDLSQWKSIKNKSSIIEICLPGTDKPIIHYFEKGQSNIFTSLNLNLNCPIDCDTEECLDLPDGIYQICVKGSPDSFSQSKDYLRTVQLQLELDNAYLTTENPKELKDKVCDIEMLIKAAEANVRNDNFAGAQELFEQAEKETEKLKNCQDCV